MIYGCFGRHECPSRSRSENALLLESFRNKLADPRGYSFHLEQIQVRSMRTLLRYRRDGQTDGGREGRTAFQLYIVEESHMHKLCILS